MVLRREWTILLSENDLLDLQMERHVSRVVGFAINYRAFIGDAWHTIWRQDTAHGQLHCHLPGGRIRVLESEGRDDYAQAFTRAEEHIKENWRTYRWRWHDQTRS